jgi:hypothetical protein
MPGIDAETTDRIALALLPADGPTGGFTSSTGPVAW